MINSDDHFENFKKLDIARAAFCALAFQSSFDDQSNNTLEIQPIHTNKIIGLAKKFGLDAELKEQLEKQESLGEICHLGNGYWFPAPTRRITFFEWDMIITIQSTPEIRRSLYDDITIGGYARFCPKGAIPTIPVQTIEEWLPVPIDIREWTLDQINISRIKSVPFYNGSSQFQVYASWTVSTLSPSTYNKLYWLDLKEAKIPPDITSTIIREKLNKNGSYIYKIAFLENGKIINVCEDLSDHRRLLHGLDIIFGVNRKFFILNKSDKYYHISIPTVLPKAEERIFLATTRKMHDKFENYIVPVALYPIIESFLKGLGYECE